MENALLMEINFISLERLKVMGEQLDLIRVSRTEMGAYLCIAQNGVPPSISKRIILNVECKYYNNIQKLYERFVELFFFNIYV